MPGYAPSKGTGSSMGTQAGTFGGGGGKNTAAESFRSSEAQKMGGVSTFTSPGGKLNQAQFNKATGRTATNPYGYAAPTAIGRFFANTFGPENLDYSGITPGGTQGIATLNALALDVFNNPYAETNILGQATGANPDLGIARSGAQPGQYTSMGTAKSYRQDLSPMGRVAAGLASLIGTGSGYMISEGTKVTGIEDTVPISARTGQPLSEAGTGTLSFLGDIMTGGQSQYVGGKTKGMVDRMMDFFTPNQQTTDIQPSDVAVNPMSAYSETSRPASGVPQLGVTSYGSPMAQVTAPATTKSYSSTPNRADMMAFEFGSIAPSASSEVSVAPNQATSPKSSLTMKSVPSDFKTLDLESAYLSGKLTPEAQAGIAAELQRRAERGDAMAQSSLTMIGYEEAAPASMSGTPVPPARPNQFLGSAGQPLNLIPASFDILGNPAL